MKPQLAEDDRPPATLSLDEYLSSSFSPDCDFVDGRAEERNVGTFDHSRMVTSLIWMLADRREPWSVMALPSLRMRVGPTPVRVPDLCVIERGGPREQVLTYPPLAVIEVLDEEDRFSATMEKLDDYLRFGIENVWVVDPERRSAHTATRAGLHLVQSSEGHHTSQRRDMRLVITGFSSSTPRGYAVPSTAGR
jgi:Uma2 family endonuclease